MKKYAAVLVCVMVLGCFAGSVSAALYSFQGGQVDVEYWAGSGTNETIIVIDWNGTAGPYTTEAHAFGFRWDGTAYVSDALAAIDAAGALDITTAYSGAFLNDAIYDQAGVDGDYHTAGTYVGWWAAGDTTDFGATWVGNGGGITSEELADGKIEGMNINNDNWGLGTITIPVPEPATMSLLLVGLAGLLRRRQ